MRPLSWYRGRSWRFYKGLLLGQKIGFSGPIICCFDDECEVEHPFPGATFRFRYRWLERLIGPGPWTGQWKRPSWL